MIGFILDTSALMTFVFKEMSSKALESKLSRTAADSAVLFQKFEARLLRKGFSAVGGDATFESVGVDAHALELCNGERSCQTLADLPGVFAVTADQEWTAFGSNFGVSNEQVY